MKQSVILQAGWLYPDYLTIHEVHVETLNSQTIQLAPIFAQFWHVPVTLFNDQPLMLHVWKILVHVLFGVISYPASWLHSKQLSILHLIQLGSNWIVQSIYTHYISVWSYIYPSIHAIHSQAEKLLCLTTIKSNSSWVYYL